VETNQQDNHQVAEFLVAALRAQGLEAQSGPPTMRPDDAEGILRYQDAWNWDFKEHLVHLELQLVSAKNDKALAAAFYVAPAALNANLDEICRRLVSRLLKPQAGKTDKKPS
jgi:hypothetical protein